MKRCHITILYNELQYLKWKVPFLYKNFDQLIFVDLNAQNYTYSTDGSHEFIKNYPDPENKIILVEDINLIKSMPTTPGMSMEIKRQMFIAGSKFIKDDMDLVFADDMDEFYDEQMIIDAENIFITKPECNSIINPHYLFFYDYNHIFAQLNSDLFYFGLARIARHKPANIYGHCTISSQYPQSCSSNIPFYHFACIYNEKLKWKLKMMGESIHFRCRKNYIENIMKNFKPLTDDKLYGYPHMHYNPDMKCGVKRFCGKLPWYLPDDI